MHRILSAALVASVIALAGCETTTKTPATASGAVGQSNLHTFSKGITALNKGDMDALGSIYAEDAAFVTVGDSATGPAGVTSHWAAILKGYEGDVKMKPQLTLSSGNDVVSIVHFTGTHKEFWIGPEGHTHENPNMSSGSMGDDDDSMENSGGDDEDKDGMDDDSDGDADTDADMDDDGEDGDDESAEAAEEEADDSADMAKEAEMAKYKSFPSGKVSVYVAVHQVYKNGKVIKERAYFNPAITAAQLGAMGDMKAPLEKPWDKRQAIIGTGSQMELTNAAKAEMLTQAINDRDMRVASTVYDENVEAHSRFFASVHTTGKAEVLKGLRGMLKSSSNMKEDVHTVAAGDWVATIAHTTGTNDGPMPDGTEATNKGFDVKSIGFYRFKNGKVVEQWGFGNGMELLRQLELLGKPGDMADAGDKDDDAKDGDGSK